MNDDKTLATRALARLRAAKLARERDAAARKGRAAPPPAVSDRRGAAHGQLKTTAPSPVAATPAAPLRERPTTKTRTGAPDAPPASPRPPIHGALESDLASLARSTSSRAAIPPGESTAPQDPWTSAELPSSNAPANQNALPPPREHAVKGEGLRTPQVAARIREEIKAAVRSGDLPKAKYSVRTSTYSMGSSITLTASDLPFYVLNPDAFFVRPGESWMTFDSSRYRSRLTAAAEEVERKLNAIVDAYHWDRSDPQRDHYHERFHRSVRVENEGEHDRIEKAKHAGVRTVGSSGPQLSPVTQPVPGTPPHAVPRAPASRPRPTTQAPLQDFAQRFEEAFRTLDLRGNNYVLLLDLRRALPDVSRAAFDAGMNGLRRARRYALDSADGRHVRLPDEALEAGIREGSSLLVYAARTTDLAETPRDPAEIRSAVWEAFRSLRDETSLRNVSIARLLRKSGVERSALHRFLEAECRAHRANPTRGDPTAATPEERAAGLHLGSETYLYIELHEEPPSSGGRGQRREEQQRVQGANSSVPLATAASPRGASAQPLRPVTETSRRILEHLVAGLNLGASTTFDNGGPYMAVHVNALHATDLGVLYSVAHYFEQNGDLVPDPDVVFLRRLDGSFCPVSFQDSRNFHEPVHWLGDGTIEVQARRQADIASFANTFLRNIARQQDIAGRSGGRRGVATPPEGSS